MPFKAKPVVTVGKNDWAVRVPRPPKHATHARLTLRDEHTENGKAKQSTLPIQDFGCFKGVAGTFSYLRMDNKGKISQEYDGQWQWDGWEVEGIKELENHG